MLRFAMEIDFKRRNQSGIVAFHPTKWARHIHWIHICSKRDDKGCNCSATQYIKNKLNLIVKWKRIRWTRDWEANVVSYLSKSERQTIQAFRNGQDIMAELTAYRDQIQVLGLGVCASGLRCEYDSCERPRRPRASQRSGAPEGIDQEESSGSEGEGEAEEAGPSSRGGITTAAMELNALLGRKFPSSIQAMEIDPEFRALMQKFHYTDAKRRDMLVDEVWKEFSIDWNRKSLKQMIMARLNTQFLNRRYYTPAYSYQLVLYLLSLQTSNVPRFIQDVLEIFDKENPKVNTLYLLGPGGSGKTWFIQSLLDLVWSYGKIDAHINKNNLFQFSNLLFKRCAVFNEFNVAGSAVDIVKEIFEGNPTIVNKKFKDPHELLRTPIFITTNNNFLLNQDQVNRDALQQRMIMHRWSAQSDFLKPLKGYPHPLLWAKLISFIDSPHPIVKPDLDNPEWDITVVNPDVDMETYNVS